jgi:hypothetical protein
MAAEWHSAPSEGANKTPLLPQASIPLVATPLIPVSFYCFRLLDPNLHQFQ